MQRCTPNAASQLEPQHTLVSMSRRHHDAGLVMSMAMHWRLPTVSCLIAVVQVTNVNAEREPLSISILTLVTVVLLGARTVAQDEVRCLNECVVSVLYCRRY